MKYTAFEWLCIDAATQYGHKIDKATYDIRLQWTLDHMDELETMDAEDMATYQGAVLAIRDTQAGIPTGHLVGLDSASSGFQLLAVCTRCTLGMESTGVIDNGTCPDFYTELTTAMDREEYDRKTVKYSAMPWLYGSKRAPEDAFGEDIDLFYRTIEKVAPRAVSARNILINTWTPFAEAHEWFLPDGFHVYKEVKQTVDHTLSIPLLDKRSFTFRHKIKKGLEESVSNAADVVQSIDAYVVREMHRRCNYAANMQEILDLIEWYIEPVEITDRTQCISLVEVEHIDCTNIHEYDPQFLMRVAELIKQSMVHKPFALVTIHDEFRCHANNVEYMRQHYNEILWDLYNSDLLMDIVYQLTGKQYKNWEHSPEVAKQILQGNYSIN
jgi:hypothetical protein